jgi:hypothetical protein
MTTIIGWAVAIAVCLAGWSIFLGGQYIARAQHNHSQGHDEYKSWSSRKVANCCSDRDCSGLAENEVREDASGTQVLILGQWCPVLREHYIVRGKSPDWNVSHACINKSSYWTASNCERLLCFSGKGGF